MQIHHVRGKRANSYIVEQNGRVLIIDVSFLSDGEVFDYLTRELARPADAVDAIVCTHGHGDHLGGVTALAGRCGAEIYIPPLTSGWRHSLMPSPSLLLSRLRGTATAPGRLEHGASVPHFPEWEVLHTPGHTADSCCFWHSPSGSLVTGDTLLGSGRTGKLVLPALYRDREELLRSIEALGRLAPRAVYPGHGSPISGDDLVAHLLQNAAGS